MEDMINENVLQQVETQDSSESKESSERPSFDYLYKMVNDRYESAFGDNEAKLEKYIDHYEGVVDDTLEIGEQLGLSEIDMAKLEVEAILHDLTKGDPAPDDVPDGAKAMYWLVAHGMTAANEIRRDAASEDNNEIKRALQSIFEMKENTQSLEEIAEDIASDIEKHMGPHPGFMSDILNGPADPETGERKGGINKVLRDANYPEINHPAPENSFEDKRAQALLAADMRQLASPDGVKKVMGDRESIGFFQSQDQAVVENYKSYGLDIKKGQVAFLSAYESAIAARDMVQPYGEVANSIVKAVGETENYQGFVYGGEKIIPSEAIALKAKFDKHVKAREIIEKYGGNQGITAEVERKLDEVGLKDVLSEPREWLDIKAPIRQDE